MESLVADKNSKVVKVYFQRNEETSSDFVEFKVSHKKGEWSVSNGSVFDFFKYKEMKAQLTKDLKNAQFNSYKSTSEFSKLNKGPIKDLLPEEGDVDSEETYVDLEEIAKKIITPELPRRATPNSATASLSSNNTSVDLSAEGSSEASVTSRNKLIYATRLDEAYRHYSQADSRRNSISSMSVNSSTSSSPQNNEVLQGSTSTLTEAFDLSSPQQGGVGDLTPATPRKPLSTKYDSTREYAAVGLVNPDEDSETVFVEYIDNSTIKSAERKRKRQNSKGDCRLVDQKIMSLYPKECKSVALCERSIVPLPYLSTYLQLIQQIDLPRVEKPIMVMPIGIRERGMLREEHVVIAVITRDGIYIVDSKNNEDDYKPPLEFLTTSFQSVFNRTDCSRYAAYTAINLIHKLDELAREKLTDSINVETVAQQILQNALKREKKSKQSLDGQSYDVVTPEDVVKSRNAAKLGELEKLDDKKERPFNGIKFTFDNIQNLVVSIPPPKKEELRKIFDDVD